MRWTKDFYHTSKTISNPLMKLKYSYKQCFSLFKKPMIMPFLGYAGENKAVIMGSVIEETKISRHKFPKNKWKNISDIANRYWGIYIPFVRIKIHYNGDEQIVKANEKGIFETIIELSAKNKNIHDHNTEIHYEIMDTIIPSQGKIEAKGNIMYTNENSAQYGVISDIDDTILVSYATSKLRKLYILLLKNAKSRVAFSGITAFYKALRNGTNEEQSNPVFYVSNSDWNLYDLIKDFCDINEIPDGPLILKQHRKNLFFFGMTKDVTRHKLQHIRRILNVYGNMKFILIGDSGQHDPEVYTTIAKEYPQRILAIYIRNIGLKSKLLRVEHFAEETQKTGIPMLLVKNTEEAANHAAENEYIFFKGISDVMEQKKKEEELPSDFQQIISQ